MKYLKILQILVLGFAVAVLFSACGETKSSEGQTEHTEEHAGHDHDEAHAHDHDEAQGEGHAHDHDADHGHAHGEGAAYTSAYVCPMHCEGSGGEGEGKCPACGMDYVAQADHVADGHTHE